MEDRNYAYYKAQQDKIQLIADIKKRSPMISWETAERPADGVIALQQEYRHSQIPNNAIKEKI